jgi:hypothetical protein
VTRSYYLGRDVRAAAVVGMCPHCPVAANGVLSVALASGSTAGRRVLQRVFVNGPLASRGYHMRSGLVAHTALRRENQRSGETRECVPARCVYTHQPRALRTARAPARRGSRGSRAGRITGHRAASLSRRRRRSPRGSGRLGRASACLASRTC